MQPAARVYLDSANGTPLRACAKEAISKALDQLGNPSSLHAEGRQARHVLEEARGAVARLIGARAEEIVLTSSGTEANAWALASLSRARESKGKHIVVSAVEHLSILQTLRRMEKEGWAASFLQVDNQGRVDPDELEKALTPETALVSIQWANGEVGTLQRMKELVTLAKERGILFHTDAVAAAGQVPINLGAIPVDALSLAANTFGGPPGIGALFLRKGVRVLPLFVGGTQEEGRRAGTENLLGTIGMGEAASEAQRELLTLAQKLTPLREKLAHGILKEMPEAHLNGHPTERLPGHLSVSFPGAQAESLVLALDLEGIAVGIGSACTARTMKASHVLKAMGVQEELALGTVTLTLHSGTTQNDIDRVLEALTAIGVTR